MELNDRDDPVSLQQCNRIHKDLQALICTKVDKVEDKLTVRLDAMDRANLLVAEQLREFKLELSKHLDTLNHYKEQEKEQSRNFLSVRIFDDFKDSMNSFRSEVRIAIKELTLAKDRRLTLVTWVAIISIFVSIVGTIIKIAL